MRSIPFYPMMVLLLVGLGGYLGCDPGSIQLPNEAGLTGTSGSNLTYSTDVPARDNSRLLLGSFNMERLGPKKLGDPWVMERFAAIIQQFDVIALQEITSKDQTTLPRLVDLVNAGGARYSYIISERIGRAASGYYEQYAFVFDTTRVRGGKDYSYTVEDDRDVLHREPFVGRFQTISANPFGFTLVNMHTDPDDIRYELDVLADVYVSIKNYEYPEEDVILLGDLNAAPGKLQRLEQLPGVVPLINGLPTNTRKSKTLDNFLVDSANTREYTGRAGTMDLAKVFQLQLDDVERLSDHLPIWAEFSMEEAPSSVTAMAATGAPVRR